MRWVAAPLYAGSNPVDTFWPRRVVWFILGRLERLDLGSNPSEAIYSRRVMESFWALDPEMARSNRPGSIFRGASLRSKILWASR